MRVSATLDPGDPCALCGEPARDVGICAFRVGTSTLAIAIAICNDLDCRLSAERAIAPLTPLQPADPLIIVPGGES